MSLRCFPQKQDGVAENLCKNRAIRLFLRGLRLPIHKLPWRKVAEFSII